VDSPGANRATDFGLLAAIDIDAAHAIVKERVSWLLSRGIDQFLAPYPIEYLRQLHQRTELFGQYHDGRLVGIVALKRDYLPDYWEREPPSHQFGWLCSFFTSLKDKGTALGDSILEEIDRIAAVVGYRELRLDCYRGDGFLPSYYSVRGWKPIDDRPVTVAPGRVIQAVLMKKVL